MYIINNVRFSCRAASVLGFKAKMTNPCPLCEFSTDVEVELESHMLTHSKESLIDYLLHRKSLGAASKIELNPIEKPTHSKYIPTVTQEEQFTFTVCVENRVKKEKVNVEPIGQTTKSRLHAESPAAPSTSVIQERKRRSSTDRIGSSAHNVATKEDNHAPIDKVYTIQIVEDSNGKAPSDNPVTCKSDSIVIDNNPCSSASAGKVNVVEIFRRKTSRTSKHVFNLLFSRIGAMAIVHESSFCLLMVN